MLQDTAKLATDAVALAAIFLRACSGSLTTKPMSSKGAKSPT